MINKHYEGEPSFEDLKNHAIKLGYEIPKKTKRINIFYDAKLKITTFTFEIK